MTGRVGEGEEWKGMRRKGRRGDESRRPTVRLAVEEFRRVQLSDSFD